MIFTARSLLSPVVCPSVRPSVTLLHFIHKAEDIVKLLVRPGSPAILVFFDPSVDTQIQGQLQRERKIYGVGKICDFRRKSPLISETVRDRPMAARNVNRKPEVADRSVSVPMTLRSDPNLDAVFFLLTKTKTKIKMKIKR